MEFDLLIRYNMRNIFLKKPHTKYVGATIPRPQQDANPQPLSS